MNGRSISDRSRIKSDGGMKCRGERKGGQLLKNKNSASSKKSLELCRNSCNRKERKRSVQMFNVIQWNYPSIMLLLLLLTTASLVDYTLGIPRTESQHEYHTDEVYLDSPPLVAKNHFSLLHHKIEPRLYHGVRNTRIASTHEQDGFHVRHLTLRFHKSDGQEVIVDLKLNEPLLPHNHFIHYQSPDGMGYEQKNFTLDEVDHCHYVGKIRGNEKNSSVAISTCDNAINGVIFDGHDTFYVHADGQNGTDPNGIDHYLMKHSDMDDWTNKTCGYKGTKESSSDHIGGNDHDHSSTEFNRILRYKRALNSEKPTIRGPYNANRESSYVELILVVDNKVYKAMDESLKRVHNHCKTIANIINAVYSPLNIYVALIGVVVWSKQNEVELSSDGDKTLKNFLQYRRKNLVKNFPNDNAQLLTREQFEGGVVGKALKGPICTYEFSGGVSMDHSQIIAVVATTVAHEIGHNFGMEHDTAECKCVDDRCIMSASSSSIAPKHWSSCSIDQLNLAFHQGMNYCLRNKPKSLFDSPQCGNGFVEPGEQCDCGLPEYCENSCCDPYTCMLRTNASCATGACCDLSTCRPKIGGTVCRDTYGECDLPEYCTGDSEYCPEDVYKRNTEMCNNGKAYCYEGACRSRTDQCKVLWGISGNSSDECYQKNAEGSRHGNCGYDRLANEYLKCNKEDVYCGMLHCRHSNEKLEFGMESVSVLSHSFLNHVNRIVACRTAIIDLGLQSMDPGLAPNGAKCGDNRMCVDQKCLSIQEVIHSGKGKACPNDCNGNGVCNSEGNCHCEKGFAPPDCINPGPGGSHDSGPASNPNTNSGFVTFLYIVFLGIIPVAIVILILYYYIRHNGVKAIFKRPFQIPMSLKSSPTKLSPSSGGSSSGQTISQVKSLPTSPDDNTDEQSLLGNTMFGKFKGFTLKPLLEQGSNSTASAPTTPTSPTNNVQPPKVAYVQPVSKVSNQKVDNSLSPTRAAPSVPKIHVARSQSTQKRTDGKPVAKINRVGTSVSEKVVKFEDQSETPPALPPLNPGSQARPLISGPILESSTSNAKEIMSPLKSGLKQVVPVRPAPRSPPLPAEEDFSTKPLPPVVGKEKHGLSLNRIKSFMKKDSVDKQPPQPQTPAEQQKQHLRKAPKFIDRNRLKTIEISAPIPQLETQHEINNRKSTLSRTMSMRDSLENKEQSQELLHSFGSTRSGKIRPGSVAALRPKSPPPPRPPVPTVLAKPTNVSASTVHPSLATYQQPSASPKKVTIKSPDSDEYKDCEPFISQAPLAQISEDNSPVGMDNIYSVIDEQQPAEPDESIAYQPHDTSLESIGLLGEIVNEIENINLGSIYSATTLKKSPIESNPPSELPRYANANDITSEDTKKELVNGDYMPSNASTTSSGYMRPLAVTMPVARIAPSTHSSSAIKDAQKPPFSSFKAPHSVTTATAKPSVEVAGNAYKPYHASINRPFATQYSVPNNNKKVNKSSEEAKTDKNVPRTKVVSASTETTENKKPVTKGKPQTLQKPSGKIGSATTNTNSNNVINSGNNVKSKVLNEGGPKLANGALPIETQTASTTDSSTSSNAKVHQKAALAGRQNGKVSNVASLQQKFETAATVRK